MRAYYWNSTFQRLVVENIATIIKNQEECKQNDLKKLAILIQKIINFIKKYRSNTVLKYNIKRDKLVVCKIKRKEMLPRDLYLKQNDRYNLKAETNTQNNNI